MSEADFGAKYWKQYLRSANTHLTNFKRHFASNVREYYEIEFLNQKKVVKRLIHDHRYLYPKAKRVVCISIHFHTRTA